MMTSTQPDKKSLWQTFGIFFAILFAIIIPIFCYISRSILGATESFPLDFAFFFIIEGWVGALILSIGVAAIYTLAWRLSWLKIGHTTVPRLLLAVFCASAIAYFAPVLPNSEQLYFAQHKSEFEHQVELYKHAQPISDHGYLGSYGNLGIYFGLPSHAIAFGYFANTYKSEYAYVYAEQYSDLDYIITCSATDGSGGVGRIYTTLSTNWYLCYRTG